MGENLVFKLWPKMLSANQISVFLNRQYFINELASECDFLHVDRSESTQQGLLSFQRKFFFGVNRPILA